MSIGALVTVLLLTVSDARRFPFTLISDVHYDPRYGTPAAYGPCTTPSSPPMGQADCDSPLALIQSVFDDIAATSNNQSYLLFTGDWLRHGIAVEDAEATFRNLTKFIGGLPHLTIPAPTFAMASLGNNDFIPDYYFDLHNPPSSVADFGSLLREANLISDAENATFAKAAFYTKDVEELGLRFIVLNTLLYSTSIVPALDPSLVPDPMGQFSWLDLQLQNAKATGMSAVIVSHVPPMMNSFQCAYGNFESYLQGPYLAQLKTVFQKYNGTIVFQFYGHTHQMDWMADEEFGVPGLIIPSITQIFGNMASYLTAEYDDQLRTFLNFKLRHLTSDGTSWADFTSPVGEVYLDQSIGPLSTLQQARATAEVLMTDLATWERFAVVHAGGVNIDVWPGIPISSDTLRLRHACSILAFEADKYTECLNTPVVPTATSATATSAPASKSSNVATTTIVLAVAAGALGIGLLSALLLYIRRRYTADAEDPVTEVALLSNQGSLLSPNHSQTSKVMIN